MTDSDAGQLPAAGRTDRLHLSPRHRETLEALLHEHLPGIEVWAYGSRVNGESHDGSDLDLVLRAPGLQEVPIGPLADFTEALHNSTLPFLVEARDWARLPERFHREIERGYVVVQKGVGSGKVDDVVQWRRVTLNDVIDLRLSSVDKKSKANEQGVQLCNYTDVYKNSFIHAGMDFMLATATEREIAKCSLVAGDVVITKDSEKYDDIGVPALVREDVPNLVCGYHLAILRPCLPKIDGAYLFYALSTDESQQQFHSYANGITRFGLRKSDIGLVEIFLPPLPEQRTIAHILSTLDDKIELNRRMNETLEAMARALFKSWFVDFDPVRAKMEGRWHAGESLPGLPAHLYDLFPDRLVESEFGEVPEGWEVKTLGDLCHKPQYGYTASAIDEPVGPKFLRITDINKQPWINWSGVPYCKANREESQKYRLCEGDILIARMADPGHGVLIEENYEAVFASYLIRFRTIKKMHTRFLQYWLKSSTYWQLVQGRSVGTTRFSLNAKVLGRFPLLIPRDGITDVFSGQIDALRRRLIANASEMQRLGALRDALLPKLISGELHIKDVKAFLNRAL